MSDKRTSYLTIAGAICLTAGLIILFPYLVSSVDTYFAALKVDRNVAASRGPAKQAFASAPDNSIVMPRIGIKTPIIGDIENNDNLSQTAERLAFGVARYSFSVRPGARGNSVFTGHNVATHKSSMFAPLYLAQKGDFIIINYKGRKRSYQVKEMRVVYPDDAYDYVGSSKEEQLTLITCYPPPIDVKRLIVIAKPVTL